MSALHFIFKIFLEGNLSNANSVGRDQMPVSLSVWSAITPSFKIYLWGMAISISEQFHRCQQNSEEFIPVLKHTDFRWIDTHCRFCCHFCKENFHAFLLACTCIPRSFWKGIYSLWEGRFSFRSNLLTSMAKIFLA